jgi:hypothetical protein|tara:strand:- start:16048 stop:16248 length:201 start_codon:yes stop_codon:yes gene_type:complete
MAAKKESKAKTVEKKEKVEVKKEEVKTPEVQMVTVMRFNKIFNRREKMTVPKEDMILGYYGDIVAE